MNFRTHLTNILAAFTLSIVTLSMGAAFGIMIGRGALAGMLSAAVLAFLAPLFGGTRIQCSGPTAPVSTLVVSLLATQALPTDMGLPPDQFLNLVFVLSGVLLALSGVVGLGRFIALIPNVIISGFMTGIGLLIFQSQLRTLLAQTALPYFGATLAFALGAFCVCLISPILLRRWVPQWAGLLSGTFLALLFGTCLAQLLPFPLERIALPTGSLFSDLIFFSPTALSGLDFTLWAIALWWALQLAFTLYLDTLMTALIIDRLTHSPTPRSRELIGQGVSGVVIGLMGGIPGAQATVRSVLLHKEGATHRYASALIGLLAFILLLAFRPLLRQIPSALFIGILFKVALDIIDFQPLRLYFRELTHRQLGRQWLSRHDDAQIFVTHREILFIITTALGTLFWGLIPTVLTATATYLVLQRTLWAHVPMRDLQLDTETESIGGED